MALRSDAVAKSNVVVTKQVLTAEVQNGAPSVVQHIDAPVHATPHEGQFKPSIAVHFALQHRVPPGQVPPHASGAHLP